MLYKYMKKKVQFMKHIILGNSAAGFSAATQIRELNKEDQVIIISKETTPIYAKIMLPYYIGNDIDREKLFLKDLNFYDNKDIELILGKRAQFIDVEKSQVILDDSSTYVYDKLLIAIGGIPFVPPVENLKLVDSYTISNLSDADKIKERAKKGENALIVGCGLTGVEMAFALSKLGMNVTLVERGNKILPMLLSNNASNIMAKYLERAGITIRLNTTLDAVEPHDIENRAILSDGSKLPFDMLIFAIGSRPNISIVEGSPIEVSRGILVDEYMKTSVPNIFAAGDIAEPQFSSQPGFVSSYIWPNAMAQGKCAANNMLGYNVPFDTSSFHNTVQLKDVPFYSVGLIHPTQSGYEVKSRRDDDLAIYKRVVTKDGLIYGVQMIGDTTLAREAASHIKKKTQLSMDEIEKYITL